jgi:transposase
MGHPAICIETRHAKAAMQAQQVKTDRNDARGIAHIMRTGWYKEVYIKSHVSQKLRILLANRRSLLTKRLDMDNEIRGTIKVFGLKTGRVTPTTFEARVRELIGDDQELQAYIVPNAGYTPCTDRTVQEAGEGNPRLREGSRGLPAADDYSWRGTADGPGLQNLC